MKLAVIDTETTALSPEHGEIVEVALVEVDTDTSIIRTLLNRLCYPGGIIDLENAWVVRQGHITAQEIRKSPDIWKVSADLLHHLDYLPWTSYNRSFDASFLCRKPWNLPRPTLPCIMEAATQACKIPQNDDYKWPKLSEAHSILLDGTRQGSYNAHRALDDALMAAEVLLVLINDGYFKPVESVKGNCPECGSEAIGTPSKDRKYTYWKCQSCGWGDTQS